jgi:hypothetical protein
MELALKRPKKPVAKILRRGADEALLDRSQDIAQVCPFRQIFKTTRVDAMWQQDLRNDFNLGGARINGILNQLVQRDLVRTNEFLAELE